MGDKTIGTTSRNFDNPFPPMDDTLTVPLAGITMRSKTRGRCTGRTIAIRTGARDEADP